MSKPPFSIASMKDLPPWNGLNIVSTFSGMGGLDLGFRFVGFKVLWANEFVKEAARTYLYNDPGCIMDIRDIRRIDAKEDILAKLPCDDVDVVTGSPPCKSFSVAGRREAGWGETGHYSGTRAQRTDDLFPEFVRIVSQIKPKVFVSENVPGLVSGKAKKLFSAYMQLFRDLGYIVEAKILDAQYLGVPQRRKRLFFIGVREDLHRKPAWPKPLRYVYSVKDALPYVSRVHVHGDDGYTKIQWAPADKTPIPTITVAQIRAGKNAKSFYGSNLRILTEDGVRRRITSDEAKRLATVPEDFRLTGGQRAQLERIARCVPPRMSQSIAERLFVEVFQESLP